MQDLLDYGRTELVVEWPREIVGSTAELSPALAEEIGKQAAYSETNALGCDTCSFENRDLFIGSGVIEAGCKSIVGVRLKQSGMSWTVRGVNALIALRCSCFNRRLEDFRAESGAACNLAAPTFMSRGYRILYRCRDGSARAKIVLTWQ